MTTGPKPRAGVVRLDIGLDGSTFGRIGAFGSASGELLGHGGPGPVRALGTPKLCFVDKAREPEEQPSPNSES